tara:strand:- start:29725 stop:29997 length:273 start_codon:yes stop_codon:yes gene_type:complete
MSDIEVEVNDKVETDNIVRQMMDKMASGDTTGAADDFNVAMGQRVGDALATRKQEVADTVFNTTPEMEKMGLVAGADESIETNGETDEDV